MHPHNLERFTELLSSRGLVAALLTDPATITWLTGYAPPIETGPSPFEGTSVLGWWHADDLHLIVSDMETAAAQEVSPSSVRSYQSSTIEAPLAGAANQAGALLEALKQAGPKIGKVGVEWHFLTGPLIDALRHALPSIDFVPLDGAFAGLRAVKSPEELTKIRTALGLCDAAQRFMQRELQPGKTELELWASTRAHVEGLAGGRLPILADLVAGARTAEIGGPPSAYRLQPGDPLILDFVPRVQGYWGDNAATFFAGQPSSEMEKAYRVVRQALQRAVEAARPGIVAGELDALVRQAVRAEGYEPYPHHTGHGMGASYHEEPRIVPYSDRRLETGMVVALEPGIYLPGVGGVRLEDVVLITAGGNEVLTTHLA
jgi:Xaa-Pro aminopeptidase